MRVKWPWKAQKPKADSAQSPPVIGQPQKIAGPSTIAGPSSVTMEQWAYIVKSLQEIRINKDGVPSNPLSFNPAEDRDNWVDWNKSLDEDGPSDQQQHSKASNFYWFKTGS